MEKYKLSRKVLPLILAMMLVISSFPISVAYAADSKLASVSVYTNPSKAVIDDSEQSNIVVNYNDSFNLDWVAKDASIGRTKDGWWIGIKVIAPTGPEGYTVSELKDSKFQTRFHGKTDWSDVNFWNSQDSDSSSDDESIERFVGIWDYVDESELNDAKNNGENIVSDFRFDWNNDGTFEQSVTLNIDPEKINLFKESVKVYPSDNLGSVSAITEPSAISVDGSETNNVTVTNTSDITLNWSQKDDSIGRAKDGWWLGVKVSAPLGMGKTELENAKFQFKAHGKTSWTDAGNFWDIRDSGNSSSVWTGLWLYFDQTMKDAGSTIVNYARIDWNGDGVYEQTVKVSLDPEKLNLDPTNLYAMDTEAPEFSEDTTADAIVWVNDEVEIAGKAIDKGTVNNGTTYTSGTEKVEYARGNETETRTEATFDETTNGFSLTVTDEFLGRYYIFATDKAGNESSYDVLVKLDNKKPTLSNVAADVTDWTKNGVEISGEAADTMSGVEKIVYKLGESGAEQEVSVDTSDEGKTATFTIPLPAQNFEGIVYINAVDESGLKSDTKEVSVKMDNEKCLIATVEPSSDKWTNEDVVIYGTFSDNLSGVKAVKIVKDGETTEEDAVITTTDDGKTGTFTYTASKQDYEGNYLVYSIDKAENDSTPETPVAVKMDITKPVVETVEADPSGWTNGNVTISGTFSDNLSGVKEVKYKRADAADFTDVDTLDIENKNFSFTINAQDYEGDYVVYCTDNAGNISEEKTVKVYMDITSPSDVEISYSTPISKLILSKIFWFYNPDCTVTLSSTDDTSKNDASGIASFTYSYTGSGNITVTKADAGFAENETDKSAIYTFTIPAQFRGTVTASAVDNAGNSTANETADTKNIVVDDISADIKASYPEAVNKANGISYYDGNVVVTLDVTEENFMDGEYPSEVRDIKISAEIEDENGEKTTKNYQVDNWARVDGTDKWEGTFTLTDEGDYVITVNYTDKSGNVADTYTKKNITIDKTAPVVAVDYETMPKTVHTIDGRAYYNANRSATVTVTEHNFRASDFETKDLLKAVNILGDEVTDYIDYFKNEDNWEHSGNTHTIKVNFVTDANYTFDFAFVDLAKNACEDYSEDLFTVDKTAPKNLKVSYSTSVLNTVINAITFGFYDKQMTVTISADDETTGIYHFVYSYLLADGVSKVNAELINDAIKHAKITLDGKTSTATFTIPKSALTNNNQFNGTVEFTAYDFSENSTEKADTKRVVVDNISPTATISYNNPTSTNGNVSYYAGNIDVTIEINEANFYSNDVVVTVNGSRVNNISWKDNSVDKHTGTFTISGDGDYTVGVSYTDKSGNKMADYTSNQLTIDTKDPVISVSGIKHQSANNDETIGFVLTIKDRNLPASGVNPTLTAVVRNENGQLETIAIQLGNPSVSTVDGDTVYTYTVTNLDIDGYYSLTCSAVDFANHRVELIGSDQDNGGRGTEQTLNFSVNREGSTFYIETHHNFKDNADDIIDELNGEYVNGEVEIDVHEINVDQVDIFDDDEQKTTFTLNDGSVSNDIVLVENTNYTKNTRIGKGGWYETVYTLNNDNFDHDGKYSFDINTHDRAGNDNINKEETGGRIQFTVDRTNPVIKPNVKTKQVIDADEFTVEFTVNDVNPDEEAVEVSLNSKILQKEDLTYLGNNKYSFKMDSDSNQYFRISTVDLATNNSEKCEVKQITISTNPITLFYYGHTVLFWIIVASIVVLASGIMFLVFKRRKKDEED